MGPKPDPDFKKHLKGSPVGSKKLTLSTNLLDYFSGYGSLNARYSATHRFILEGGFGFPAGTQKIEYANSINYTPNNSPYTLHYEEILTTGLKTKSQLFGCIHYVLASIGSHTFVSFGFYKRFRSLDYTFQNYNINDASINIVQTGGSMASQTKVGRRLVIGWFFGLGQDKFSIKNYPIDLKYGTYPFTRWSEKQTQFGMCWQFNLGYIL